jgi:ubiquinone/menaquinone biosynthesis C-methylase UbiE
VNRARLGQKFARVATDSVIRSPRLWRIFRPLVRKQFDAIAPTWDTMRGPESFAPFERAVEAVSPAPTRVLDLGTGTGEGAFAVARRFPQAEVLGVDLAEGMLAEAKRKAPSEMHGRVRFERGDASALPFPDESFDLVTHANMIPFFDELARVSKPGGQALFAFSMGDATPIYVSSERLRTELQRRGFTEFAEFAAGSGTALLARKADRS